MMQTVLISLYFYRLAHLMDFYSPDNAANFTMNRGCFIRHNVFCYANFMLESQTAASG